MVGITYMIFTFGGITDKAASFSDVSSQMSDLENKLVKTAITAQIQNNNKNDPNFDIDITNQNIEKLWEFDKFDVIVTYTSGSIEYTETMRYSSTCPPTAGEWCVSSWSNDIQDPGILNYGETVRLNVELNIAAGPKGGTDMTVVVSTQNGVVATHTKKV